MNIEQAEQKKRMRFFAGRMMSCIGAQITFSMLLTALSLPERREPFIPLILCVLGIGTIVFCVGLTMSVLFMPERKVRDTLHKPLPNEIHGMMRASRSMYMGMLASIVLCLLFFFVFRLPLPGCFLAGFSVYMGVVARYFQKGYQRIGKEQIK